MPTTASKHDTEQKLAAGMESDSREVFDQLFRSYAPALLGYITRLTGDEKASEEALQKSFIEIWNNRKRFNPETDRLFTWMLKITKAVTLGFIPKNRYLINLQTQNLFSHDIVNERKDNGDATGKDRATALQGHLMDLMHFNNYSLEEACTVLKIEESTVRSELRNAINKLKTLK